MAGDGGVSLFGSRKAKSFFESDNLLVDVQRRASLDVHQLHHHLRVQ